MKKHLLIALLVLVLCIAAGAFAEGSQDRAGYSFREDYDALDSAAKSLFYVEVYNRDFEALASASGFVCFEEHLFVTNYHVIDIEGAAFLRIWDDDDNRDGKRPVDTGITVKLLNIKEKETPRKQPEKKPTLHTRKQEYKLPPTSHLQH